MLSCVIDATEGRKVATLDIPGGFMQADMDELVYVKYEGVMADLLIKIDPDLYSIKIQNEMLANQIIMERTLLPVMNLLKESSGGSIGSVKNLKEPLRSVLSSIEKPNSSSAFLDSGLTDASRSSSTHEHGD